MNKRWNEKYEAPTLEVVTVAVELGFGTTSGGTKKTITNKNK